MMASELICEAIRRRKLIAFEYHGLPRLVSPYCHGWSKREVEVVRGVQLQGASSSGGFGFGKLWVLAEMQGLRVSSDSFVPDDPDYNPNDSAMRRVHCCVRSRTAAS